MHCPTQQTQQNVTLEQVSDLLKTANDVLNAIGLGTQYMLLPADYEPTVQQLQNTDSRPDIERMLDEIVKNNSDLYLPETKPDIFKFYWVNCS